MTDLTAAFLDANKRPKLDTDCVELHSLLQKIAKLYKNAKIDWDDLAGEEWARILCLPDVVCLIHKRIRLAFVLETYDCAGISEILKDFCVVRIDSWKEEKWSIDYELLREIVPYFEWETCKAVIDTDKFSLSDFYVATV